MKSQTTNEKPILIGRPDKLLSNEYKCQHLGARKKIERNPKRQTLLNKQQMEAFSIAKAGHNLYIFGQAGVGKYFIIQSIAEYWRYEGKTVAITCTTGIACAVYPKVRITVNVLSVWTGTHPGTD